SPLRNTLIPHKQPVSRIFPSLWYLAPASVRKQPKGTTTLVDAAGCGRTGQVQPPLPLAVRVKSVDPAGQLLIGIADDNHPVAGHQSRPIIAGISGKDHFLGRQTTAPAPPFEGIGLR